MAIIFVSGDIIEDINVNTIAHGCNCLGVMGAGIAKPIKQMHPKMFFEYREMCENGTFTPGSVFYYEGSPKSIFNLGTQSGVNGAKIEYIELAFVNLAKYISKNPVKEIGIPRIGAGLGGLDWDKIKQIISNIVETLDTKFIVFETFIQGQKKYVIT
jgi:O-acetyl-ADP-ribose deacetylase (regulator of RNase III)